MAGRKSHCGHIILVFVTCALGHAATLQAQPAFRGFWADAFHPGFKSTSEIDTMVSRARQGNYNAVVAEVLAYKDSGSVAHGAYWNSSILPKAADISGGIDPLAYLCQRAHAEGIEVHAWLVTYRVSTAWPPPNNATLANHPEWFMVPYARMGSGPQPMDGKYFLDPGSPEVQEYLVGIVRELVSNYPIDGINWDYIRYTQTDAGYPAVTAYAHSSLARFQRIAGYVGTPPTTDASWQSFRRRTINELVRRCRAEIPSITTNPRQPLRHTADLICSGDAPANFTSSSAYSLFQDWRYWMEMGWLDAGIPMNYKDERNATHAQWYRDWINAAIGWRYSRHMYCGQGNYMNSKANSVTQLQYVYGRGANGSCNYAYYSTADENDDGTEEADFTWYAYVSNPTTGIFTSPVATPTMPWRNPATATEGTLWGRITDYATGGPIDDATVQAGALSPVQTDGNGYYAVTLIPATQAGTAYNVTAAKTGYSMASLGGVLVVAGDVRRADLTLGEPPPCTDTLLSGFEGYANGASVMFRQPSYSGSTSTYLAASPNISQVTDEVSAFSGGKCQKLSWQFVDGALENWLRATTYNTANVPNPTIELNKPVRVRVRFESPAGASLRVSLGIRETGTTAAVGANGGTSGALEWIGPAARYNNAAPQGKLLAAASGVWQTLVFDPLSDPVLATSTGDGVISSPTGKGTFEHLAFSSTGGAGPFVVYVDQIEQLCTPPPGMHEDLDHDEDVDLSDFTRLQACFNGPNRPAAAGCAADADFDHDGDVDLADFAVLQGCFNGPNRSPACP
jgi:uncharacterized lipoprotein YddW (UPF0748 family)